MDTPILVALRDAESVAWEAVGSPTADSAERTHRAIAEVLRLAERLSAEPVCEAAGCSHVVEYSGVGRPRRFCSDRCRKAAHRASRRS